jgi:hypothetical protein
VSNLSNNTGPNNNNPIDSGHSNSTSDNNNRDKNENVLTSLGWVLVLGISMIILGAILLTLRSVFFSLILIIIGISLFAYWLGVGTRSRGQSHDTLAYIRSSVNEDGKEVVCTCSICKHKKSGVCLELNCACCILMRNKQIIGHFNDPPQ